MACTDGKNTYLNIKELPEITDIISGDFLIVETPTATSILDYDNFIITLDNTTFGDTIVSNTTNIAAVSSSVTSLNATLTTQISSLSSSTARSNTFVTFSLLNYNSPSSPVILQQSNVSGVTLNTQTSAVTVFFKTNFNNANYCVTTGVTNGTPVVLLNTSAGTNQAEFRVRAAPQLSAFSTATKVSIQIINV
jgi:hypothetical protein